MTIINQATINNNLEKLMNASKEYIKPNPVATIVVTKENSEYISSKVSIVQKGEWPSAIFLKAGELDDVEYRPEIYYNDAGKIKDGIGIMLQLKNGKLDVYLNETLFENYKEVEKDLSGLAEAGVPEDILPFVKNYTKTITVKMIKIYELKEILGISLSNTVQIQAKFGLQKDVENNDFLLIAQDNSYKVDINEKTEKPVGYINV